VVHAGLRVIAIAIVIAASGEVMSMIKTGSVTLADLLMLFLYLERKIEGLAASPSRMQG
jgi:hypothetical protein